MSDLADKIPREWQQSDIRYWFAANEKCPNCRIVLRDMHPMQNLYPHWTGQCVQAAAERQMKRGAEMTQMLCGFCKGPLVLNWCPACEAIVEEDAQRCAGPAAERRKDADV